MGTSWLGRLSGDSEPLGVASGTVGILRSLMTQPARHVEASTAAIVVPIRSFRVAKQRLSSVIDNDARSRLMREFAAIALDACGPHASAVVTSDLDVYDFAAGRGVVVLDDPGSLDGAARRGFAWARAIGADRVVVLHADLPFVRNLDDLVAPGRARLAVLVPDQRRDGTPALSLPVDTTFAFSYGPGSFARHCLHAEAAGLAVQVLEDPDLGFDVDLPEDMRVLQQRVTASDPQPAS